MKLIYNIVLALWVLLISPSALRKKYRKIILYKLGLKKTEILPKKMETFRVWIHSVSLGETKSTATLIDEIKKDYLDAEIIISTTTETGQNEAKKLTPHTFFLPLDFSWIMNRLVNEVNPDLFILVETDFWYNMLDQLKKKQIKTALVNGKISSSSYKRFMKFPSFTKALFNMIDIFCLQSDTDKERFQNLGISKEKLTVTGNLKFDSKYIPKITPALNFPINQTLVTIALTHKNEEELILKELSTINSITLLLAPRHPERFQEIIKFLKKKQISFRSITEEGRGFEKVILINKMGVMDECYAKSALVIMGGSFVPHIGGHNIYEAARHGIPVLYGPYMHNQESLKNSLKKHNIGIQIPLSNLLKTIENLLKTPRNHLEIDLLQTEVEGASKRSWKLIKQHL